MRHVKVLTLDSGPIEMAFGGQDTDPEAAVVEAPEDMEVVAVEPWIGWTPDADAEGECAWYVGEVPAEHLNWNHLRPGMSSHRHAPLWLRYIRALAARLSLKGSSSFDQLGTYQDRMYKPLPAGCCVRIAKGAKVSLWRIISNLGTPGGWGHFRIHLHYVTPEEAG